MRFLSVTKDGGKESTVWAYWLVEIKSWFSVALLCFEEGSRDAYHTHAFNSVSWVLWGTLGEQMQDSPAGTWFHYPSLRPIYTYRDTFHKVTSKGRSWVLTFRGPWVERWQEHLPATNETITLTHGRQAV